MIDLQTNKRWPFWIILGTLFFVFIYLIRSILLPFVLGIFIAYLLHPLADKLEKTGTPRGYSAFLITLLFFLSLLLLSFLTVPVIIGQLSTLVEALPDYIAALQHEYMPELSHLLGRLPGPATGVKDAMAGVSAAILRLAGPFFAGLFHSGMAFLNLLSLILITPVVAFYLLRDWDRLVERLHMLLPRPHINTIRMQLSIIDRTLAGFIRGQLTVCFILAIYYALCLSLIGLKFGIVIGLSTGLLLIFPYVGFMLGMIVSVGIAFFQSGSWSGIGGVVAVFVVGQILETCILVPKMLGEKVGLHPVWIIFGMLSGAALFGFVGILLAVPVTAVIGVLIRFALTRYLQSDYYQGGLLSPPVE